MAFEPTTFRVLDRSRSEVDLSVTILLLSEIVGWEIISGFNKHYLTITVNLLERTSNKIVNVNDIENLRFPLAWWKEYKDDHSLSLNIGPCLSTG